MSGYNDDDSDDEDCERHHDVDHINDDRATCDPAYGVGYKRPPKDHQFKKGQSGNPRGRPKGSKGIATLVREGVADQIEIRIDGQKRKMAIGHAVILRLFREAAAGDRRAVEQTLKLMERYALDIEEPVSEYPADGLAQLSDDELHELDRICHKIRGELHIWEAGNKQNEDDSAKGF